MTTTDADYRIWTAPWTRTMPKDNARFASALPDLVHLNTAASPA